jgi:hypothetical protein
LAALIVFAVVQHVYVHMCSALSKINISHVLPFIIIHVGSGSQQPMPEERLVVRRAAVDNKKQRTERKRAELSSGRYSRSRVFLG